MKAISLLFFLVFYIFSYGQVSPYHIDIDDREKIDELTLLTKEKHHHPSIWPISRKSLKNLLLEADSSAIALRDYLALRNNEWCFPVDLENPLSKSGLYIESKKSFWKHFYKTPANLFQQDHEDFFLRVNPIFNFHYGREFNAERTLYFNQRGIDIRIGIDNKLYLYTRILETQSAFSSFHDRYVRKNRAIPGNGFYKLYEGGVFGVIDGFDFLNGDGGVSFNLTKHVDISLGHGRNFIGNGIRSLLLSDFADNYFSLKLNTQIGKVQYQNIFAELNAISALDDINDMIVPKKYMTAHYLGFTISNTWHIGLFESVVFTRNNQFELQYLNPLILYRTVEQKIGSPDNVLLGFDIRHDLSSKSYIYGQLVFDELVISELFSSKHWWGNKNGYQLGFKTYDLAKLDGLSFRAEFNKVRPYTFSHIDSSASYSHSNQSLSHPLGANFTEKLLAMSYSVSSRLEIQVLSSWMKIGRDDSSVSYGSNILLSNKLRPKDFGVDHLQGEKEEMFFLRTRVKYELKTNLFLELQYQYRSTNLEKTENVFRIGIRMNTAAYRPYF